MLMGVVAAGGTVWYANREPVGGTNRSHFVLLPVSWEASIAQRAYAVRCMLLTTTSCVRHYSAL